MNNVGNANTKCPYFVTDLKSYIKCEGIMENTFNTISFEDAAEKKIFQECICFTQNYRKCELYSLVERRYNFVKGIEFQYGTTEHKFYDYLIRKKDEKGIVKISIRAAAKDINVTESITRRLIRDFKNLNILEEIYKSNSKYRTSTYLLKK